MENETVKMVKDRMEDEAWNRELERLGRYDIIKKNVGTVDEPPMHYNTGIEPVKFITSHGLGFLEGNIIKYIVRYKMKGNPVEDLHKARTYIDLILKQYEV